VNEAQAQICEQLESSDGHAFVCGEAGTGKSLLLKEFVAATRKSVAVCAPTGLAATNVDGVTAHSLFRLPVDTTMVGFSPHPEPDIDRVLASLDAVVIDEASMVRADMLDAIDARLRVACESSEPFGGVQLMLFGDLMQLPPVVTRDAKDALAREYQRSSFFFDAHVAESAKLRTFELTEVMRQSDPAFIAALSAARVGQITADQLTLLNSRVFSELEDPPRPVLATRNDVVDGHNERGLASLPGKAKPYLREWRAVDDAKAPEDAPCERLVRMKPGCPVLFTRNDAELGVSNGTRATVTEVDDDLVTVECGGEELEVEPVAWPVRRYTVDAADGRVKLEEVGSFLQIPLRLGFALTVHRAQGQTYDQATVDFASGPPFVDGHGYVAVSRVRSLEGLTLTRPLRAGDFRASRAAIAFIAATQAD
jgi:hypothetical protein